MGLEDDRDMKIAGDDFEPINETGADDGHEARLLEQEKENGNLSRARRLGAILADEVSAVEGDSLTADSALLTQRRILLAFAVEVGLDALLPNSLTAQTAQDIFYNSLRVTAPRFYDDLQASGAFSFYYLCVRDGRQVEEKVGETFASLCGKKGDPAYAPHGTGAVPPVFRSGAELCGYVGIYTHINTGALQNTKFCGAPCVLISC